jgi:hypothetical protein
LIANSLYFYRVVVVVAAAVVSALPQSWFDSNTMRDERRVKQQPQPMVAVATDEYAADVPTTTTTTLVECHFPNSTDSLVAFENEN